SVQVHLTAVERFEGQALADKVVKHMTSFIQLLDYQKEQGFMSEQAHAALKGEAEALMGQW
ncbi:MAG: hypothetical protein LOD88_06445, partial [Novibacillus thermophilus]